jgi:hypothetical protein
MGMKVDTDKNAGQDCLVASKSKHSTPVVQLYERFLELPVPIVLAVTGSQERHS